MMSRSPAEAGAAEAAAVNPVTAQIVANAFATIADEMATTIFRTAHSTIVRDVMDFSAAICDAEGRTIAQAVSVPFHLGSIPTAMDVLVERYAGTFRRGDIFLMNDPFDGGIHLPDLFVVKPIITTDGELAGIAVTTAHHGDVGGRVPGSSACDNTEIFQEGLRLPWVKLYSAGERQHDLFSVISANVRMPTTTFGDLDAQIAACAVAEREVLALVDRYGMPDTHRYIDWMIDYTEQLVRAEISTWPDGRAEFTDYLDSDGIETRPVPITVEVTISGDEITADFSRSSPMVPGALNSTRSFIVAAVYHAVHCALQADIPNTAGAFAPIKVITKPGTVTHVVMPAASSMRGVTGFRAFDAVNGALAQLLGDRVPAAGEGGNTLAIFGGHRSDGQRFVFFELVCGTWGATATHDGNDGLSNPCSTAANIPVEVAEAEYPILVERYGLVADTGGAGQFRGGMAVERAWSVRSGPASLVIRSDRAISAPFGVQGGGSGANSQNLLGSLDADVQQLPPMISTSIAPGEVFVHRTAAGGGWGEALDRDPQRVAIDVRRQLVSGDAARTTYGVVINDTGGVDEPATATLRATLRAEREERR
ncbi:MAG: hydantoinase B/oxoprolinase family protein [Nitriliruptoraceae bacterium]